MIASVKHSRRIEDELKAASCSWKLAVAVHAGPRGGRRVDAPASSEAELWRSAGCASLAEANLHFLDGPGRRSLGQAFLSGDFLIAAPCEAAGLALAGLLEEGRSVEARQLRDSLTPFLEQARFYPRLLARAQRPRPGTVHCRSAGQVMEELEGYRPPREVRRMAEAVQGWRPLYERLLELVGETRLQGWPFQHYPSGWAQRAQESCLAVGQALEGGCDCHFPQRASSNLRQLSDLVGRAAERPGSLTGRQVGLARRILLDSEQRWGALGSAQRGAALRQRRACSGSLSTAAVREAMVERLRRYDPACGVDDITSLLDYHGESAPAALARRVWRAWQAPPRLLAEVGVVKTAQQLARLASQWTAGLLRQASPAGRLLGDGYQAWRAAGGQGDFLQLPWALPFAQRVRACSSGASDLLREMLELFWERFPDSDPPLALQSEWAQLADWGDIDLRPAALARATARAASGTLYERYYLLPSERLLDLPVEQEQPLQSSELWRLAAERCPAGASRRQVEEELRLLTSAGMWAWWERLRPRVAPLAAAEKGLAAIARASSSTCSTRYRQSQRHRRMAHAWQRVVFFASLLEEAQQRELLAAAGTRYAGQPQLSALLQDLAQAPPVPERILSGWYNP
jgi:hypothetical protein